MKTPRDQIREMVMDFAEAYGKELTPRTVAIYVEALACSAVSIERLERSFLSWIGGSHFFPQPDEILEANRKLPRTPEEEARAKQRLLNTIDPNPKQLRSLNVVPEVRNVLENYKHLPAAAVERLIQDALDPQPSIPLGAGMTAEEWTQYCARVKQQFLAKNAGTKGAPFPNLPELRLPKSNLSDLNGAGGETEGLVM